MLGYECKFTQSLIEANGTAQRINLWDASDNCKLQNYPNESAYTKLNMGIPQTMLLLELPAVSDLTVSEK